MHIFTSVTFISSTESKKTMNLMVDMDHVSLSIRNGTEDAYMFILDKQEQLLKLFFHIQLVLDKYDCGDEYKDIQVQARGFKGVEVSHDLAFVMFMDTNESPGYPTTLHEPRVGFRVHGDVDYKCIITLDDARVMRGMLIDAIILGRYSEPKHIANIEYSKVGRGE